MHPTQRKIRGATGFTLVEIMVVVAIIGIIAAIAYPSYQSSIRKTHRTDAKQTLLDIGQKMERYYTENNTYATATLGSGGTHIAPTSSPEGYYTLSFTTQTAATYTLRATRTTKGGQNSDECGEFTLTETGAKGVTGGTLSATNCW